MCWCNVVGGTLSLVPEIVEGSKGERVMIGGLYNESARRTLPEGVESSPRQGPIYAELFTFPLSLALSHQAREDEGGFELLPSPWSLSLPKGEGEGQSLPRT